MVLAVFAIVIGMGAVLMYISDGNPGELFSGTESYDRICVRKESYKSEARARGYVRCQFKADQRRCHKRDKYSLCLEKKLAEGEERYRPGRLF